MGLTYCRLSTNILFQVVLVAVEEVKLLHLDFSAQQRFSATLDCPRLNVSDDLEQIRKCVPNNLVSKSFHPPCQFSSHPKLCTRELQKHLIHF